MESKVYKKRTFSKKHREALSKAAKKRGMPRETILKAIVANTGRKHTEETKEKIRLGNKGKILSEETKRRIGLSNAKWEHPKGENHPNWKGGVSFRAYGFEFNNDLKKVIRTRDKYKCQICEDTQNKHRNKLSVHHIDYNKQNNNPNNLITLCISCHIKTNYHREKWLKYFNK